MEPIQVILIIVGIIVCVIIAPPLKWWIDDLRVAAVERKIIVCNFEIESSEKLLEEYTDLGTLYANGTWKASEWKILKREHLEKEKLKLQLLEHKLKKLNPPMFLADEGL